MPVTIPVAHDFICEWCWIGLHQIRRLQQAYPIEIEWRAFEEFPEGMGWPEPPPPTSPADKPKTPGRYDYALAAEGMELPAVDRPAKIITHSAHEAVEYAKTEGVADELVERIYKAYWRHGLDIGDVRVLAVLARGLVKDVFEMLTAIEEKRFADKIVPFDEPANAAGVYNTPTFFIGGERYAEQPYEVLARAVERETGGQGDGRTGGEEGKGGEGREGGELSAEAGKRGSEGATGKDGEGGKAEGIYEDLSFPPAPENRPYVFINMVTTIDGKTVTGTRTEHVGDLGTKVDHLLMRRIEAAAEAVMLGAGSLRSTPGLWYPKEQFRIVVSGSGNLDYESRFFTDAPDKAFVACSETAPIDPPAHVRVLRAGKEELDLKALLETLRKDLGIERLLVEGGSELNAQLLERELVDELFMTLAPKIKLGRDTPTYAGGAPLPRERIQSYSLVEEHRVDDEVFLRYRRNR